MAHEPVGVREGTNTGWRFTKVVRLLFKGRVEELPLYCWGTEHSAEEGNQADTDEDCGWDLRLDP